MAGRIARSAQRGLSQSLFWFRRRFRFAHINVDVYESGKQSFAWL